MGAELHIWFAVVLRSMLVFLRMADWTAELAAFVAGSAEMHRPDGWAEESHFLASAILTCFMHSGQVA